MTRLLALPLVLLIVLAVGPARAATTRCSEGVLWHHDFYLGEDLLNAAPTGDGLGLGQRPTCKGAGGGDRVRLVRYRGVHPQVAVASAGNHRHAYFAAGYMAALNSHPLRRYVKHTNLLSDLRCAQRSTIKGTLKRQPAGSAPLEVGTRLALVEPTTTYKGPKRFGLPYLAESARVTLRGCPVVRGRTKLLALVSISVS